MARQTPHIEHKDKTSPQREPARPAGQRPVELAPQPSPLALQRTIADPRAASPRDILALQRAAGNRAVTRLIQAKLTVGPARGKYEQEADRVAERVASMRVGDQPVVQRADSYFPDTDYQNISVGMFSPAMDNSGAFVGSTMKQREKAERERLQGSDWSTRLFKPRPSEVDVRVNLLKPALQRAYDPIRAHATDQTTLAIFMAPEWYFKRPKTPYTEADKDLIIQKLRALSQDYPNMLIIPGSIVWRGVVNDQIVIKNTAPVIMNGNLLRVHDKEMNAGDTYSYKAGSDEEYERGKGTNSSFFQIGNVKFALEICGDHSSANRARNEYMAHPPFGPGTGVDVHVLISHGAALQSTRSLTKERGFALQSDASPHGVGQKLGKREKPMSIGVSKLATATGGLKHASRDYYDLEVPDLRKIDDELDQTFMGEFNLTTGAKIQPKLMVGPAGDKYEQEADRVAEQVVSGQQSPISGPTGRLRSQLPAVGGRWSAISRQAEDEEEIQTFPSPSGRGGRGEGEVQRQADGGFEAGPDVESRLAASRGSGSPLPGEVRAAMEPRFGADFGGVRVHTGGEADDLNRQLSAQAFTHGQDIYMATGKYAPGTTAGNRLLAHELTHVVQQKEGVVQRLIADDFLGELFVPRSWLDTKFDDRQETVREVYENRKGKQTALRAELLGNINEVIGTPIYTITEVEPAGNMFGVLEGKQRVPKLNETNQDKWKKGFQGALPKPNEVTVLIDVNGKIGNKEQKLIISPNELVKAPSDLAETFNVAKACALIAIFKSVDDKTELRTKLSITEKLKDDMQYYEALHDYYFGKGIEYDEPVTHPALYTEWGFKMIFAGKSSFRSLRLNRDLETGKKYIFDLTDHSVYVTMKKKLAAGTGIGETELVKDYFDFQSDRKNNYNQDESASDVEYVYEK